MFKTNLYSLALTALLLSCLALAAHAQTYHTYVAAESEDKVYLVEYNAETQQGTISDEISVGQFPTEIEGPHGVNIDPNGDYWYLSVAHGNPFGWLYKFTTGSNEMVAKTELGMFPATMEISKATGLLYVVNFNLHGDMEPSTVSVVDPESMQVVDEITTGIMPHGSRITDDGRFQYHVSMMTDELMQITTSSLDLSHRLPLVEGQKQSMGMNPDMNHDGEDSHADPVCKPTWADPHPTQKLVYVACNGSDEILEVNTDEWEITNRFQAGKAPYNLEVTEDGKLLVATYKGEGATGVWNLETGEELAKIKNSRMVSHGVSISPDSKIAFISVEGIGGEPGSVDIIDLEEMNLTEVIEVGKQAGGIMFWKMD